MPPTFTSRLAFLAVALAIALSVSTAQACPACKDALPSGQSADGESAGGAPLAQGFAWSIYLMLAVPFTLVTALGSAAYVVSKRAALVTQRLASPARQGEGQTTIQHS